MMSTFNFQLINHFKKNSFSTADEFLDYPFLLYCLYIICLTSELQHWLILLCLVSFNFCIVIYWNNSFLFLFPFSVLILTELTGCYHSFLSALFGQQLLLQHQREPMTQKWAVKLLWFVSFVIVKTGTDSEERSLKILRSSTHLCYFFSLFFFFSDRLTLKILSITKWISIWLFS